MTEVDRLFFFFIRKGLWATDDVFDGEPPSSDCWEQLFMMAHSQAMTGILIDGIAGTDMRPSREVWEQWVLHLLSLEQMNLRIAQCGKKWLERLDHEGIEAFLFKGTSVASWYREPLHRSSGDVDIIIRNGWEKLKSVLTNITCQEEDYDVVLYDGHIPVEFHQKWEYVYNPLTNARLRRLLDNADETDRDLYFICLILHLRRHFLTYGVGLKQVCDVAVMLKHGNLDFQRVSFLLHDLHMEKFSRILFGFISGYIGGTDTYPLLPVKSGKRAELFQHVILNEGYRLKLSQTESGGRIHIPFVRIVRNAVFWFIRGMRLFAMMPGEVVCFWGYLTVRRIRKIF